MIKEKKRLLTAGALLLFTAAAVAAGAWAGGKPKGVNGDNLARLKGVKASSDSAETEELSADKAIDGDDETLSSRWSSENNWESAFHYIELEFPEEISVSFVVLKWERTNVISYRLEGSTDGENWQTLEEFHHAPETKRQEIPLEEAVNVKYLRLTTDAVEKREEDYSNLYQNVSLYEFEVYADKPAAYLLEKPVIVTRQDNTRYMELPKAPEGYQVTYIGADYEQVIGMDCEVYETIQDKEVTVGFLVESLEEKEAAREISFTLMVPAAKDEWQGSNKAPEVLPAVAEWDGADGEFQTGKDSRIVIQDESLRQTAELFAERYQHIMGYGIPIVAGSGLQDVKDGDFYLTYAEEVPAAESGATGDGKGSVYGVGEEGQKGIVYGVGEEGYVCDITDKCVITGTHERGIYWGTITVLQMLKGQSVSDETDGKKSGSDDMNGGGGDVSGTVGIARGRIRDYPKFPVRGFGIDVARKAVSMEMLYEIMENMSWYKMNDLCIHLNDNEILSTSGLTGSIEEAMTAKSAFRLESSIRNDEGVCLTASDYAYTAEEFAQFIQAAKAYGVQVVPEIDTPAHSLAITSLFPEYALTVRTEAVDQIDLGEKEAVELVKDIWQEALRGAADGTFPAAFAGAELVNIGMDEYYGSGEAYRKYVNEMTAFVKAESSVETVRLWGSLSNIEGTTAPDAEGLQMNLWSTLWADPAAMYEAGYSVINMQNNHLYIIPGGGYDYLDKEELEENWEPNKFYDYQQLEYLPVYAPQMLGASYMIWNDMCGRLDVGICEYDLFDRFFAPLGVLSGKLWGEGGDLPELFDRLGAAPGSNPYAEAVWEGESLVLLPEGETLTLSGADDYLDTGYMGGNGNGFGIGGTYTVSMRVYREESRNTEGKGSSEEGAEAVQEEILFETDAAYGQTAFKAVQTGTGTVGFSREGRDYSFAYTLPVGQWVELTICGEPNRTSLYVDGKLVDTLGDAEPFTEYATFVFPLERIGSKTNSFYGMITDVIVTAERS